LKISSCPRSRPGGNFFHGNRFIRGSGDAGRQLTPRRTETKKIVARIFFSLRFLLLMSLILLTGCAGLSYYGHLAGGQMRMLTARQPIESVIAGDDKDEELKRKLELVLAIREFAGTQLHLPVENQFIYYADHGRPAAVWNVYAAPEFSMTPVTWRFPIVGRVMYKGFFDENRARRFAEKLEEEGYDVHVSGAGGFSTLGWFSDPIFRNVLNRSDEYVAAYIFHELAHKVIYIKGDTPFNEGFAVAVEQEGVRRWLESRGEKSLFEQYRERLKRQMEFAALVRDTRIGLTALYQTPFESIYELRYQKTLAFNKMYSDYRNLQKIWNGCTAYDSWFASPMNNARLIPFGVYYDHVPAFTNMITAAGGDMKTFYAMAGKLSKKSPEERDRILNEYSLMTTAGAVKWLY